MILKKNLNLQWIFYIKQKYMKRKKLKKRNVIEELTKSIGGCTMLQCYENKDNAREKAMIECCLDKQNIKEKLKKLREKIATANDGAYAEDCSYIGEDAIDAVEETLGLQR